MDPGKKRKRRLRKRVEKNDRVKFCLDYDAPPQDREWNLGTIRNVSIGGVELETRFAQPRETRLLVELRDHPAPIPSFQGVVSWNLDRKPVPAKRESNVPAGQGSTALPPGAKRYSLMGISYIEMNDAYRDYLEGRIDEQAALDADDSAEDCEEVRFEEPEDLYWEYHHNLSKGRLFTPCKRVHQPGQTLRVIIRVRPLMEAFVVQGTVLGPADPPKGSTIESAYLLEVRDFNAETHPQFFEYIHLLDECFG